MFGFAIYQIIYVRVVISTFFEVDADTTPVGSTRAVLQGFDVSGSAARPGLLAGLRRAIERLPLRFQ